MSRSTRSEVYQRVLGIPPAEQPPHHYRLLGLVPYEDDAALIKDRLEQRSRLITAHRKGEYAKACDEILYQINTAKTCLLNPRLKTAYDRKLLADRSTATAAAARISGNSMAASKSTTSTATSQTTQATHAADRRQDHDDDLSLAPLPEDAPLLEDRIAEDDDPSTDVLGDLEQFLSDNFIQQDDTPRDPTEELDLVLDSDIFSLDAGATTKKEAREVDTVINGTLSLPDLSELDRSLTAETSDAKPTPTSEPTSEQATTPVSSSNDTQPSNTQPSDTNVQQPLSTDDMPAVDLLIPENAGYEVVDPEELANEGFDLLDAHDFASDNDAEHANAASEAADPAELAVRELADQEKPQQPDPPPTEYLAQSTSTDSPKERSPGDQLAASADEPVDSLASVDAVDSPASTDDAENLGDIEDADNIEATETDNQFQDAPSEASSSSWLRRPVLLAGVVLMGCLPLVGLLLWNTGSSASSSSFDQPIPRPQTAQRRPMEPSPETRPTPAVNQPTATLQPKSTSKEPDLPPLAPMPAELANESADEPAANAGVPLEREVEIGVACSTEKVPWLTWAAQQFASTETGRQIHVEIVAIDSQASARAIIGGDTHIHVWAPASTFYRDTFLREWQAKYYAEKNVPDNPLIKSEILAITPMVLVMWKSRYEAFTAKVPEVTFTNLGHAMHLKTGWETIAGKPQWGRFKFGHTHPARSNSGLMTLILLAYDFHNKTSGLEVNDVMSREFLDHFEWFGDGVAEVTESADGLMKQMILMGPSVVDALMVYEVVAIDYLPKAEGRWGQLQVIYPKYNAWNDNPYYVLNTPWTTRSHQRAAERFLEFLLDEPSQLKALEFGFRPGNPAIPLNGPDSPFTRFAKNGLRLEVPTVCKPPSPTVIENLQQTWLRHAARR